MAIDLVGIESRKWVTVASGSSGGGLPTLGTAYHVLRINAGATAAEWALVSPNSMEPGTAYDVLQTDAAGTGVEWTDVVRHTRMGVGGADDANIRLRVTGAGATSSTYQYVGYNSAGYWSLLVADDGVVGFGGSATTDGVWRAFDAAGYAVLASANANGVYFHASVGDAYLRASATGKAVYLDAPTATGTVVSRVGTGYTAIQTVNATGVLVSNTLAVNQGQDPNIAAQFGSPDDTSATRGLRVTNDSTTFIYLDVYGDGGVAFGGSATAGAQWLAYETSGYGYMQVGSANGLVLQADVGDVNLQAPTAGRAIRLDAPNVGGTVVSRIGTGYTAIQTVSIDGVQVTRLGANVAPTSTTAVLAKGATSAGGAYQFGSSNSNGFEHFFVGNDGVCGFGGSAAANASLYAWEDSGDSILEGQGAGSSYFRAGSGGANVQLSTSSTSGIAYVRASGSSGKVLMHAGTSTPGYFAVHADRNASMFSDGVASYGGGAGVLATANATTAAVIGNTAPTVLVTFARAGNPCEYNPTSVSTLRDKRAAAHTSSSATTVCSITLPNVDGYYVVRGEVGGGTATGTNNMAAAVLGIAKVDSGVASVSSTETHNIGGTGYTASLATSGLDLLLQVTAANGQTSVGTLEATGYAVTITPA